MEMINAVMTIVTIMVIGVVATFGLSWIIKTVFSELEKYRKNKFKTWDKSVETLVGKCGDSLGNLFKETAETLKADRTAKKDFYNKTRKEKEEAEEFDPDDYKLGKD